MQFGRRIEEIDSLKKTGIKHLDPSVREIKLDTERLKYRSTERKDEQGTFCISHNKSTATLCLPFLSLFSYHSSALCFNPSLKLGLRLIWKNLRRIFGIHRFAPSNFSILSFVLSPSHAPTPPLTTDFHLQTYQLQFSNISTTDKLQLFLSLLFGVGYDMGGFPYKQISSSSKMTTNGTQKTNNISLEVLQNRLGNNMQYKGSNEWLGIQTSEYI